MWEGWWGREKELKTRDELENMWLKNTTESSEYDVEFIEMTINFWKLEGQLKMSIILQCYLVAML